MAQAGRVVYRACGILFVTPLAGEGQEQDGKGGDQGEACLHQRISTVTGLADRGTVSILGGGAETRLAESSSR